MVQTFAADGTNNSFSVAILLGRSRRSEDFVDSHAFHAVLEIVAVDAVAIAKEKTWCLLVREGVDDLLRSPLGIGIRSNVEVNDPPPIVPENDENVEYLKLSRRHSKEIAGGHVRNVIVEKRSPSLGRRLSGANHVLGHGPFSYIVTQ
jgi:hypothetical protein